MNKEIEELILEKIRFGMKLPLSSEMLQSARIEFTQNFIADKIMAEFHTKILGNRKKSIVMAYFEVPENWFECLKEEKFPKWLKKIFPVKYETISQEVEFTASALFPELGTLGKNLKIVYYGS